MEEHDSATEYCLEEIETDEEIERKPPKPHGLKGKVATQTQLDNLQKGRDKRAETKKAEREARGIPEVAVKQLQKPKENNIEKPKKKKSKQVIVIQSDSDSSGDDSPPQIVIRTKKSRPAPVPEPVVVPPPEPQQEVKPFRMRRV